MNLLHRRRNLIAQVLRGAGASTQEQLVEALAGEGLRATQGTVSRDLAALGAVKTPAGYRLASDVNATAGDPQHVLRAVITRHAVSIRAAAAMVVVGTAPGHAALVADAIDAADLEETVGSIAGDDTVFVATPSVQCAHDLAAQFSSIAADASRRRR